MRKDLVKSSALTYKDI
jgi:translation initiation factor 2 alpha subunit (eIF-2alpha)